MTNEVSSTRRMLNGMNQEMTSPRKDPIQVLFSQAVWDGDLNETAQILGSKDVQSLKPVHFGDALLVVSEKTHIAIANQLLTAERSDQFEPGILASAGISLARHAEALPGIKEMISYPEFAKVKPHDKEAMLLEAINADQADIVNALIHSLSFMRDVDKPLILNAMCQIKNPTYLYTNCLKNREYGKEAPQILWPERAAFVDDKGPSEDAQSGVKPTQARGPQKNASFVWGKAQPETDSSGNLCINALLKKYEFTAKELTEAAKLAVANQCLTPYLEICESDQFYEKIERVKGHVLQAFREIDITPLLDEINYESLKERVTRYTIGTLFIACARMGKLILPLTHPHLSAENLLHATIGTIQNKQLDKAVDLISCSKFAEIETKHFKAIFKEVFKQIAVFPQWIVFLCILLTEERLNDLSFQFIQSILNCVIRCAIVKRNEDESSTAWPQIQKVFQKAAKAEEFKDVPPDALNRYLFDVATLGNEMEEHLISEFMKCGRSDVIRPETLFEIFAKKNGEPDFAFIGLQLLKVDTPPEITTVCQVLQCIAPLGRQISPENEITDEQKLAIHRDLKLIYRELYPIYEILDSPIFAVHFPRFLIQDIPSSEIGPVLVAVAGIGMINVFKAIIDLRSAEIPMNVLSSAAIYSASGNEMMTVITGEAGVFSTPEEKQMRRQGKFDIAQLILSGPRQGQLSGWVIKKMLCLASERGDLDFIKMVTKSAPFIGMKPEKRKELIKETKNFAIDDETWYVLAQANGEVFPDVKCVIS